MVLGRAVIHVGSDQGPLSADVVRGHVHIDRTSLQVRARGRLVIALDQVDDHGIRARHVPAGHLAPGQRVLAGPQVLDGQVAHAGRVVGGGAGELPRRVDVVGIGVDVQAGVLVVETGEGDGASVDEGLRIGIDAIVVPARLIDPDQSVVVRRQTEGRRVAEAVNGLEGRRAVEFPVGVEHGRGGHDGDLALGLVGAIEDDPAALGQLQHLRVGRGRLPAGHVVPGQGVGAGSHVGEGVVLFAGEQVAVRTFQGPGGADQVGRDVHLHDAVHGAFAHVHVHAQDGEVAGVDDAVPVEIAAVGAAQPVFVEEQHVGGAHLAVAVDVRAVEEDVHLVADERVTVDIGHDHVGALGVAAGGQGLREEAMAVRVAGSVRDVAQRTGIEGAGTPGALDPDVLGGMILDRVPELVEELDGDRGVGRRDLVVEQGGRQRRAAAAGQVHDRHLHAGRGPGRAVVDIRLGGGGAGQEDQKDRRYEWEMSAVHVFPP